MNKKLCVRISPWILSLAVVCLLSQPASAVMCSQDVVPAATLLLPYFEVDVETPGGSVNTVFSINNASPEPALGHMIFWTDYAAPSINFDVFLTGYDVVTVDLRDVFVNGNIALTADLQSDPVDDISPAGDPLWDGSFPVCDAIFPILSNPALNATIKERLVNAHTGQPIPSLSGACLGSNQPDGIARGYITVDSVDQCSLFLDPSEAGYFANDGRVVNNDNKLWGEYFITYTDEPGAMIANPLVHIEAQDDFNGPGQSFYSRYVQGSNADNREPIGTSWAARYQSGELVADTDFVVWRDTTSADTLPAGIDCESAPTWSPLDETQVLCFNESEDSVEICSDANPAGCFPKAVQRTSADDLGIPYNSGWCYMNLNHDCPGCVPGNAGPDHLAQSYVMSLYKRADGRLAAGLPAIEVEHACSGASSDIDVPLFSDGFESSFLDTWTIALQ